MDIWSKRFFSAQSYSALRRCSGLDPELGIAGHVFRANCSRAAE